MKKRMTAFLLCILLICSLGFAACEDELAVSSEASVEDETVESREESSREAMEESSEESADEESSPPAEGPDAREIFERHAEYILSLDSVSHSVEIISENTLGVLEFTDRINRTAEYAGLQTDSPIARVEETAICGTEVLHLVECLTDEGVIGMLGEDFAFSTEESCGEFFSKQISAQALDSSLYQSIEFAKGRQDVILLRDASQPEAWLAPKYSVLVDAYAEVTLSDEGGFEEVVYIATYKQGPLLVQAECTIEFGYTDLTTDNMDVPKADAYRPVDSIEPYYSTMYATIIMERTCYGSGNYYMQVVSHAIGCALTEQVSMYHTVFGGRDLSLIEDQIRFSSGYQSEEYSYTLRYENGETTYTEDGKEPEVLGSDNRCAAFIEDTFSATLDFSMNGATNMNAYDMGDFWYIEFEMDEELAETYADIAMSNFLEDPSAFDAYVSDYRVKTFTGHFAVDKDTKMPVSASMVHVGAHVIQGREYELNYTFQMDFLFGDSEAYNSISDTPLPEEAPEKAPTPVFYEVTSPNGNKMYLLGTIHIGDNRTAYLPQEIYNALAESDALAVEINVNTLEERLEKDEQIADWYREGMLYTDGTTMEDHLDEEWYAYACRLSKLMGYAYVGDTVRPSVLASGYGYLLLETDGAFSTEKGVDKRLLEIAENSGKKIYDVEDLKDKLTMDSRYSDKVQEWLLQGVPSYNRAEYTSDCMEMFALWCEGNEDALREYLKEEIPEDITEDELQIMESYNDVMIVERDGKMFQKAVKYLESDETVFMAVGLAHVLGETGLVDALREAGYTVSLVAYS